MSRSFNRKRSFLVVDNLVCGGFAIQFWHFSIDYDDDGGTFYVVFEYRCRKSRIRSMSRLGGQTLVLAASKIPIHSVPSLRTKAGQWPLA